MKIIEYREGQELPDGVKRAERGNAYATTSLGCVDLEDHDLLIYDDQGKPQVARWQRPNRISIRSTEVSEIIGEKGGLHEVAHITASHPTLEAYYRTTAHGWIKEVVVAGSSAEMRLVPDAPWPALPMQEAQTFIVQGCAIEGVAQRVIDEIRKQAQKEQPFAATAHAR